MTPQTLYDRILKAEINRAKFQSETPDSFWRVEALAQNRALWCTCLLLPQYSGTEQSKSILEMCQML